MKDVDYRVASTLENTEQVMMNTFWIGVHPGLSEEMLNFTCDSIDDFVAKHAG